MRVASAARRSSIGIGASLLKGADYEEAAFLALLLLVLWRARPAFRPPGGVFETRFSAGWIMAVVGAVSASVWLGLFALQARELLARAVVAVRIARRGVTVPARPRSARRPRSLLFAMARLLEPAAHESSSPMRPTSRTRAPSSPRTVPDRQPRLPARQGGAVRRGPEGLPDVGVQGAPGWRSAIRSGRPRAWPG